MTGTMVKTAVSLCIVFCLAACGSSPPSKFYRLTAGTGSIENTQQLSLGVGPIEVPEFLNRSALVYTRGENRLLISSTELWAEPLAEGVQRIIGLNLAQLLDTENLSYFPWDSRHLPEYGVRVSVLDLDANEQQAMLTAEWIVFYPTSGDIVSKRISQHKHPLPAGTFTASELPPAYSNLLYQLSETIAAEIRKDQQTTARDES